jgi:hypothetical protein
MTQIKLNKDPRNNMYVDEQGCHHDKIWQLFWFGTFKFCGCGSPESVLSDILHYLEWCSLDHEDPRKKEWFPDGAYTSDYSLLLAYLCDEKDLTEHGSGIGWCWLTDSGKFWLSHKETMEQELEQMDEV